VPYWPTEHATLASYRAAVDLPVHVDIAAPPGPAITNCRELVQTVAQGQGVAFVPASSADHNRHSGVVFVPVSDISPSHVVAAWSRTNRSPAVAAFVRAAVAIAHRRPEYLLALA
jgi:DNA-binding transcriptional LysR family regulator